MLAPSVDTQMLRLARNYIADPAHFTTGVRHQGDRVCALGAIEYADDSNRPPGALDTLAEDHYPVVALLARASRELWPGDVEASGPGAGGYEGLPASLEYPYQASDLLRDSYRVAQTNNQLGHEATVQMFDRAIELSIPT